MESQIGHAETGVALVDLHGLEGSVPRVPHGELVGDGVAYLRRLARRRDPLLADLHARIALRWLGGGDSGGGRGRAGWPRCLSHRRWHRRWGRGGGRCWHRVVHPDPPGVEVPSTPAANVPEEEPPGIVHGSSPVGNIVGEIENAEPPLSRADAEAQELRFDGMGGVVQAHVQLIRTVVVELDMPLHLGNLGPGRGARDGDVALDQRVEGKVVTRVVLAEAGARRNGGCRTLALTWGRGNGRRRSANGEGKRYHKRAYEKERDQATGKAVAGCLAEHVDLLCGSLRTG